LNALLIVVNQMNFINLAQSFSLDIHETIEDWLTKTVKTDSPRASDIRNDKGKAVAEFFKWLDKSPEMVQPDDVQQWLDKLIKKDLASGTIYYRLLALKHYFEYLRSYMGLNELIPVNPAKIMMPKSPGKYLSKNVKALTTTELFKLLLVVENHALSGKPLFLRDYAILQLFVVTGRRRQEIIGLTGEHIKIKKDSLIIRTKLNNNYYNGFELNDRTARNALFNYLKATGRDHLIFGTPEPLWLRHDNAANRSKNLALTSYGFASRMKIYAVEAGIKDFHIHKLRHTYASVIVEEFSSLDDARETMGYANLATTKIYIQRLKVIKDNHSNSVRRVIENERENNDKAENSTI
jgi:site-specific recombinase XerD